MFLPLKAEDVEHYIRTTFLIRPNDTLNISSDDKSSG